MHMPQLRPRLALAVVVALCAAAPLLAQPLQERRPGHPPAISGEPGPGPHPHMMMRGQLRTVTVAGEGEAIARPDRARIRLGVQTQAPTAAEALRQNSARMDALVRTLREAGIPENAIQTQVVNLWPEHAGGDGREPARVVGYRATNVVEARVDQLDRVGGILDRAVAAGGNTLEGVSFEIANPDPVVDRAREDAMGEARRKAEQLARLAGAELGPVLTIDESGGGAPPPYPMPMARNMAAMEMAQDVPVSPGEQRVTTRVAVTWELRVP